MKMPHVIDSWINASSWKSRFLPLAAFLTVALSAAFLGSCDSGDGPAAEAPTKPALLVVLSFDQMRNDYLDRWSEHWSDRGFARLMRDGRRYTESAYKHATTETGPGHAIIGTGSYPRRHGIVQNNFFDKRQNRSFYAVEDASAPVFGIEAYEPGRAAMKGRSPRNLQMPTLGDWIKRRLPGSKSVSISSKDRAAICMGGHLADAVVWLNEEGPGFTTSIYYDSLAPTWLKSLDVPAWMAKYSGRTWNGFLPEASYKTADSMPGEGVFAGGGSTYPHVLPKFDPASPKSFVRAVNVTPFAAELTFEAAKTAVREFQLGADTIPDILTVSISSTDYAGHLFGPDSREMLDVYLKCDTLLGDYIDFLDETVGKNAWVLAISADHGVGTVPETAAAEGKRGGRVEEIDLAERIDMYLTKTFPTRESVAWLDAAEFPNVFINQASLDSARVNREAAVDSLTKFLMGQEDVALAISGKKLMNGSLDIQSDIVDLAAMSAYPDRTGDVMVFLPPNYLYGSTPAGHGSPYEYDRRVPLLFYGWRVVSGNSSDAASPADIAPTFASFIGLELPNVDGHVLSTTK